MLTTGCAARAASFRLEGCRREGATLIVERPSPNHAPRPGEGTVDVLVLHYTELPLQESLNVLTDGTRPLRVSSHYVLAEDGTVYRLVPEDRVAWHAGISYWRGHERLNETSIGIEIVNLDGDKHDYPPPQIAALIELCRGIMARHPDIVPRNVVGHSDIAPQRKVDPGRRFPWATLAAAGVGLFPKAGHRPIDGKIHPALQRFGYAPPLAVPPKEIVKAFQRHYRPSRVDGMPDPETLGLLADLLDQVKGQA